MVRLPRSTYGPWAASWPSYWLESQSSKEESEHDLLHVFILPLTDGARSVQLCRPIESNIALSWDALRGHPSSRWFTEGWSFRFHRSLKISAV